MSKIAYVTSLLKVLSLTACCLMLSPPGEAAAADATPVRSFCGFGFHRGPYHHCVRNGTPHGYPPSVYAPADPDARLACPNGYFHLFPYGGCFAPACAYGYGYYLGPDGQCFPYWPAVM
ncbi:MAG: hypothetical protein WBF03_04865 [Xanthobacteraceae bacterium]